MTDWLIFNSLAGLLYEETGNTTYQSLGLQTLQFMEETMWDSESSVPERTQSSVLTSPRGPSGLVRGVYDAYLCGANTGQSPEVQGWYIYPLSIFANITAGSDTGTTLISQYVSSIPVKACVCGVTSHHQGYEPQSQKQVATVLGRKIMVS